MNWFDRTIGFFSPEWALQRESARLALASMRGSEPYDAVGWSRRTSGWSRHKGDADSAIARGLVDLRIQSRRLLRGNLYARRAREVVVNNVIGWGIVPSTSNKLLAKRWRAWAESSECDWHQRTNFAGLQRQVMRHIFSDGEVLVIRRLRNRALALQVLEADHLDHTKNRLQGEAGGPVVQGVEFDASGRRVAYWIFPRHPGSSLFPIGTSGRVDARDVLHIFDPERAGQTRAVGALAAAIVDLSDLGDFDDAEMMRVKIASCFAAFIGDSEGALGTAKGKNKNNVMVEEFEPGMIVDVGGGKSVTIAQPPQVTTGDFALRRLRKVAAGVGLAYEDFTADYSQVNFSSARMGRIVHKGFVRAWQYTMLAPQLLGPVWEWHCEVELREASATWTFPPLEMVDPASEVLAETREIRAGRKSWSESIREQGEDPDEVFEQIAADQAKARERGVVLDSDASATTTSGQRQTEQQQTAADTNSQNV